MTRLHQHFNLSAHAVDEGTYLFQELDASLEAYNRDNEFLQHFLSGKTERLGEFMALYRHETPELQAVSLESEDEETKPSVVKRVMAFLKDKIPKLITFIAQTLGKVIEWFGQKIAQAKRSIQPLVAKIEKLLVGELVVVATESQECEALRILRGEGHDGVRDAQFMRSRLKELVDLAKDPKTPDQSLVPVVDRVLVGVRGWLFMGNAGAGDWDKVADFGERIREIPIDHNYVGSVFRAIPRPTDIKYRALMAGEKRMELRLTSNKVRSTLESAVKTSEQYIEEARKLSKDLLKTYEDLSNWITAAIDDPNQYFDEEYGERLYGVSNAVNYCVGTARVALQQRATSISYMSVIIGYAMRNK